MKPFLTQIRKNCNNEDAQEQDDKGNIPRIGDYGFTYKRDKRTNNPFQFSNKIALRQVDNHLAGQPKGSGSGKFQNNFNSNVISKNQTNNVYSVQRNTMKEHTNMYNTNTNRNNDKIGSHENKNGEKFKSSNETDEAYIKFISEITNALEQHELVQVNEQTVSIEQRDRTLKSMIELVDLLKSHNKIPNENFKKNIGIDEVKQYPNYEQGIKSQLSGNKPSVKIYQINNKPKIIERYSYNKNENHIKDNFGKKKSEGNNSYSSKPNSSEVKSGNRASCQRNQRYRDVYDANSIKWANKTGLDGETNDISNAVNMQCPFFYSPYFFPQMYQYWPIHHFGNTNPPIDLFNHQNYGLSMTEPKHQSPVQSFTGSSTFNNVPLLVPQPYTGIAGYNWPTIRKPLKSAEPEQKNEYPVYVKPPVHGDDETEDLRNAYKRYIKWLRLKAYHRTTRKQKQIERREKNLKKIRNGSATIKNYKSVILGAELGEENIQHCEKNPDKLPLNVLDFTEQNENKFKPHLETNDPWTPSYGGPENTDIADAVPESDTPFEYIQNKSTENCSNVSFKVTMSTERPLNGYLNLETDSFEISDHDFLSETHSSNENQHSNYHFTRTPDPQSPTHPIYGPVCSWKEVFLDEN